MLEGHTFEVLVSETLSFVVETSI